jgi:hypothetical protein
MKRIIKLFISLHPHTARTLHDKRMILKVDEIGVNPEKDVWAIIKKMRLSEYSKKE